MPYFTAEHLRLSLTYFDENTHPTLPLFLAMIHNEIPRRGNGPDGRPNPGKKFGTEQLRRFLEQYFSPPGGNEDTPYYSPFGKLKQGSSRWKSRKTPGSNFQRQMKDKVFIFPREGEGEDADRWLPDHADEVLSTRHGEVVGVRPLSLHHLAVWFLRDREIDSHEQAIQEVLNLLHLGNYDLIPGTFSPIIDPDLSAIALGLDPIGQEIGEILGAPINEHVAPADGLEEQQIVIAVPAGTWDIPPEVLNQHVEHLKGVQEAVIQAIAALRAGMHVVFTGPPGSGKTDLAQKLCLAAGFPTTQVTATDHWGTFETIGGYFPDPQQAGQVLEFLAGEVITAIRSNKILIIDEINRADIDKAFGELFTLLSGHTVDLPYLERQPDGSRRRVRLVPHGVEVPVDADIEVTKVHGSWRLIAAMNDADKASLKRLSYAFLRRFAFISVTLPEPVDYEALINDVTTVEVFDREGGILRSALVELFAKSTGLASIDMSMGFAIPKAMAKQAVTEGGYANRSVQTILRSALELYVAPQFQGRADKHSGLLDLVSPFIGLQEKPRFDRTLATWTGFKRK